MSMANWLRKSGVVAFATAALLMLAGCGDAGPPRYHLSGNVTYDGGKPVPAGSVTFLPSAGNTGPATSVPIVNGRYDTAQQGTGHIGGPHLVKITGLDGKVDEMFPQGTSLFPDYEMQLDLPKQDGTQDLEVPADWKPAAPTAPASGGTA